MDKKVFILFRKIKFSAIDTVYYDEVVDIFENMGKAEIFKDIYERNLMQDSYDLERNSCDRTIDSYYIEEKWIK